MHGQQHQNGMQAGGSGNSGSQGCESEEGRVAGAHNDGRTTDNSHHYQHHSHRTEAQALAAVNHSLNGAHGNETFGKGLTCYNQSDYVGHLQT